MSLGSKLKENRMKLNVTQEELGKKLHVSRQTISNWEVGRSYPDIESLILLSDIFNLSLDKLLREDTRMVASLKKRNLSEMIYFMVMISLIIGGVVSASVDLIINRSFTWSLMVLSSCLLSGVFISVFKYAKSDRLMKASLLSSVFLYILFLTIKQNVAGLDWGMLLKVSLLWYLFYLFIVVLLEKTTLSFWNLLILIVLASIPLELFTRFLTNENILGIAAIVSQLSDFLLLGFLLFARKTNLDKGKMAAWLTNYRAYTQAKK